MEVTLYLLGGLAVIGALVYALMQVNVRQQRLNAELTRLERLTAEVTMNAEAILDKADQRIEQLNHLAAAVEARAVAQQVATRPDEAETESATKSTTKSTPKATTEVTPKSTAGMKPAEAKPAEAKPTKAPGRGRSRTGGVRKTKAGAAPAAQTAATPVAEPEATPASQPNPKERYDHLRQEAFGLADQGLDPLEIATRLAIPRGEVQLMLNLRGRKGP